MILFSKIPMSRENITYEIYYKSNLQFIYQF